MNRETAPVITSPRESDTHNVWIFCCLSPHEWGQQAAELSLEHGGDNRYGETSENVDIDLASCRHATTRGDRALRLCCEAGEERRNKFLVVKLVRAFGGCLGTKRR